MKLIQKRINGKMQRFLIVARSTKPCIYSTKDMIQNISRLYLSDLLKQNETRLILDRLENSTNGNLNLNYVLK